MATTIPNAFFAYASSGNTLREPIRDAVNQINVGRHVNIKTWEECSPSGTFLINTICKAIDESDLFFADLTGLNANVMFELGYAIARNKRIWLIFDDTYQKGKNLFNQLKVLTTVGYVPCCNSEDIVSGFYRDKPYLDTTNTIFHTAIEPNLEPGGYRSVFHLKSQHENQAAMRMSNLLQKRLAGKIVVDDPRESPVQALAWYGIRVFGCNGVLCHFTDPGREGADLQTARHALVCGMAHGFDKPLLMLAEGDFLSPIDYRDYLKNYNSARDALRQLEEWLPVVEDDLQTEQKPARGAQSSVRLEVDLKRLRIGEYLAENEAESLVTEYFIRTAAYEDALKGKQTVFVGRKGSGKTANLMKLKDELSKHRDNLVCEIRPQAYQMQGIVDLLKQYQQRNVKGYTIESLWKFLLLTEIANVAFANLESSQFGPVNDQEHAFSEFVTRNAEIICEDFSTRLESCIQDLDDAMTKSNNGNSYLPVSEALHSGILKELRSELGKYLSKKQRVAILVDNLDKAWERQNDIKALSEILSGLLDVGIDLRRELERNDSRRQPINFSLAIFLRSDIFYGIRKVSREPDKMPYSPLSWDDTELLCRIIEERFSSSFDPPASAEDLWNQYFCPTVNGTSTRTYITEAILKKPRDIIFLVNESVTKAITRQHTHIDEEDVISAARLYSQHACESVSVENTLPNINLEDVILEFIGVHAILTKNQVLRILERAGIPHEMLEITIKALHEFTFLGLEVENGRFAFSNSPEESRKNKIWARRFAEESGQQERFEVHNAFRPFLEIKNPARDTQW